jgi:DNA-binding NtrC family response regulator
MATEKRVMIVDPDSQTRQHLEALWQGVAIVESYPDFPTARRRLTEFWPDLLITNLRLGAYNGLHLLHVASTRGLKTRTLVYADNPDPTLIKDAQASGAFHESRGRLPVALPAYLETLLPPHDRRTPVMVDRRRLPRGGRRRADQALEAAGLRIVASSRTPPAES